MTKQMTWPGGAKVAVLVSYMLETWSPGRWPSYFTRTSPLKEGYVDIAGINWSQYGGNEGAWRILRMLDAHDAPGSMVLNGRSAEVYPELVKEAARRNHPLVAHAYHQDELLRYLDVDAERSVIIKTLDAIEKVAGRRPVGWATPIYGHTEKTPDLLVQEKMVWTHDALDTSTPYRSTTPSGSIMMFPWTDFVDNRVLRADPSGLFNAQKDAFDYVYQNEPMGIVHIGLHSHVGGRPTMAAQLNKLLAYFRQFDKVWYTTAEGIVNWMLQEGIEDLSYRERFFPQALANAS
jgi:allantoinase